MDGEQVSTLILDLFREKMEKMVTKESNFFEMGVDSLDLSEITFKINIKFGTNYSPNYFFKTNGLLEEIIEDVKTKLKDKIRE